MSFFISSENTSFSRSFRASQPVSLTPHTKISSYFDKFDKNSQLFAHSRQISQVFSETKSFSTGKACSYHGKPQISAQSRVSQRNSREILEENRDFPNKLAQKYGKTASIYISVDEILRKMPENEPISSKSSQQTRPKTGKSCSTHLLSSQRPVSQEELRSPTGKVAQGRKKSDDERGFFNIYSQKSLNCRENAEKTAKLSQIMRKIEGIQRNFEDKLLYRSLDYAKKPVDGKTRENCENYEKPSDFQEKSRQILRNVSNTQTKSKEKPAISSKTATFFEKENENSRYYCRINEKLYSKIVDSQRNNGFFARKSANCEPPPVVSPDLPSKPSSATDFSKKSATNAEISTKSAAVASKKPILLRNRAEFHGIPREFPEKSRVVSIEDFQIGKCLGKGRFGSVFLAKDKRNQGLVALKVIKKKMIKDSKMANQIKNEIKIQSCLTHPNVLSLYGFFQDAEQFYLVLEYAPHGELYRKLKKQVGFFGIFGIFIGFI